MAEKVGTKTSSKSSAGRDVYKTPEGELVSEKSVTLKIDDDFINVPSIHGGVEYSEDEIYNMLVDGKIKPTSKHKTLEEAIEAAKSRSDKLLNKGGAMLNKQMELFEPVEGAFDEGGLMQEGGTVDAESGNEVPVGSTQEEVRDDIPAQLSEGEFVFPADVVRYIGLENLMRMRQEAKMGLAQMEAMGQMGNSEEATMPDDLPFDMYDLEVEDDGVQDFAQGGVVQAQAGTFVMPQTNPTQASQFTGYQPQYTPYTPPAMPAATAGYTPPMQQTTPVSTTATPTFTGLTGIASPSTGGYDEMKTYVNDSGMEMQIPFKDGSPIYPIPEGYKLKGDDLQTAQTTTTTGTGVETVRDTGSDEDGKKPEYSVTDVTGLGYDRSKIEHEEILNILNDVGKSQISDFSMVNAVAKQFNISDIGKIGTASQFKGVLDNFRGKTVEKGVAGEFDVFKNTTPFHEFSNAQYDEIVSRYNDVKSQMKDIYGTTKPNGDFEYKSSKEVRDSLVDKAKELGINTNRKGSNIAKHTRTLEKEIASEIDRRNQEKKKATTKAAMETGEQRREEQKQAAADASKYGISATRADGSKKSAEDLRGEIATELTNRAKQAEAEAAARRTQRSGGGDDDAPDQSTYAGSQAYGAETFGISGLAKGGLVEQMKQSGLASKK